MTKQFYWRPLECHLPTQHYSDIPDISCSLWTKLLPERSTCTSQNSISTFLHIPHPRRVKTLNSGSPPSSPQLETMASALTIPYMKGKSIQKSCTIMFTLHLQAGCP
ncbi:hypothetical protein KIL84_008698 [Mauremys mutica]|uniref:Uncharacterized protein n=1 Tax=Mauremys mutica TaxID=74926 RepID=A0A9D3X896_9SAUR|nr:hypothetical protein KIL84_008698 [Mauremys mutica]